MKCFTKSVLLGLSLLCCKVNGAIIIDEKGNKYFREEEYGLPSAIMPIEKELFSCQTDFQEIEVFKSKHLGNVLVLDGVIQLSQGDNFAYHEMMVHVPLFAHPNPEKVLIVGGGDGGVLDQVLKHTSVKEVVLCEIDKKVVEVSKQYFSEFAHGFDNERATIKIADAIPYIKAKQNYFDVILIDSTDHVVAETLFGKEFYQDVVQALTADGIVVTQSECLWIDKDFIVDLHKQNKKIFKHTLLYFTLVPSYVDGTSTFSFFSNSYDPFEHIDSERIAQIKGLKYYNEGMHKASFQLPQFVKDALKQADNE